ncbi:MAG TPA: hypothetical protein VMK30_00145 [Pleomorphomonadaceae bacterium]|nr:hypothetical protein [Pleomorphomonadaceae bacterium]
MNRTPFRFVLLVGLGLLLAACAPTASQQPSESSGGEPPAAESQPAASQPGGGGGGANGSVQYEVSGDYSDSGELAFVPEGSFFDQNGSTYLSFTNQGETTVLFIQLNDSGNTVQFGNQEASVTTDAAACTFNLTRDDATGAAGTFDCPNAFMVIADGSQVGSGTIRGTFEAHI